MTTLPALIADLGPDADAWQEPVPAQIVVALAATPHARARLAARVLRQLADLDGGALAVRADAAAGWPFQHPVADPARWPSGHRVVCWTPDVHDAFVNAQTNSTRLVTTQPMYVMQEWRDALSGRPDVTLIGTADPESMRLHAPEALERRGPWREVVFLEASGAEVQQDADAEDAGPSGLAAAFRSPDPAARLDACLQALNQERTPAHLLAMASTCMEVNDLDNAATLLDEAVGAAPSWAAAHFEQGKLWLRRDDMERAGDAFGRAAGLMPSFASAAANWGAALGELDRPEAALAAFTQALAGDPDNAQALNNVGVVSRELGRLAQSEAAFRRVITLTPNLAFGHYNLGHTLFLQGRYQASQAAYAAGQHNDPDRNPVQASRLALARLAAGDAAGALRDLQSCTATLPPDYRRQVLGDTHAVAWALLTTTPELPGWRLVGDWLSAELARG